MIYSPLKDHTETNKNKTNLHNIVSLNTKPWDSHPYASPEGPGTTPYEKYQSWSNTGPLGAAMRLTSVRQSPKDISRHPKNSGNLKTTPEPQNESFSQLFCDCIPNSLDTGKCGSERMRAVPYDNSVRTPSIHACSHPYLNQQPIVARTYRDHMFSDTETNKLPPKVTPPTDTQHPYGTLHTRKS